FERLRNIARVVRRARQRRRIPVVAVAHDQRDTALRVGAAAPCAGKCDQRPCKGHDACRTHSVPLPRKQVRHPSSTPLQDRTPVNQRGRTSMLGTLTLTLTFGGLTLTFGVLMAEVLTAGVLPAPAVTPDVLTLLVL